MLYRSDIAQDLLLTGCRPFVPNLRIEDEASNTNEPYLEFYQHLMTLENEEIAQVISLSYGDDEQVRLPPPLSAQVTAAREEG